MSGLNKLANRHGRRIMASLTTRPTGVLLFTDLTHPNTDPKFQVSLTSTEIGITRVGETPSNVTHGGLAVNYKISYPGKSAREIAAELNNSKYPVAVKSLCDIGFLQENELIASGANIPESFDALDRGGDGASVIIRSKRWAASYNKLAIMQLRPPYDDGSIMPWWPRVRAGSFTQRLNGITYFFGTPEYAKQPWATNLGYPFADVLGDPATFIDKDKIQLGRVPVLWKGNNIVITDVEGSQIFPPSIIEDVDSANGIIYIKPGVALPTEALVYYSYLERHLIYKNINVNGHFSQNPFLLDKYVLIYALPISSSSGISRSRGIYHSIGNSIEEAVSNISDVSMEEPIGLIGAIHVSAGGGLQSINVTDTRSYGGGLRDDKHGKAAEKQFPQSQYFNDLSTYDGINYHGSAAVVVTLPSELTSAMTKDHLKKAVTKFVAKGVYTIIDFNDQQNHWRPTDGTADISGVQYGVLSRDSVERVNFIDFTSTFYNTNSYNDYSLYGHSNLLLHAEPTTWSYQPMGGAGGPIGGIAPQIHSSMARADGRKPVWELQLQTGNTLHGYLAKTYGDAYHSGNQTGLLFNDPLVPGTIQPAQTFSLEVKQSTSSHFSLNIYDRLYPNGNASSVDHKVVFEWQGGAGGGNGNAGHPRPISYEGIETDRVFSYPVREGWHRVGITYTGHVGDINNIRQLFIRCTDNEDGVASTRGGSGLFVGRPQVEHSEGYTRFQEVDGLYNQDLRETHWPGYGSRTSRELGAEREALGWVNDGLALPTGLTTGYHALTVPTAPDIQLTNEVTLEPGNSYYLKYVRGAPHARFFWEEQDSEGQWQKHSHVDTREVPDGTIAAGKILFNSKGNQRIRNLSGFAPFRVENWDQFTYKVADEFNIIYEDLSELSYTGNSRYAFSTGEVIDIATGNIREIVGPGDPGDGYVNILDPFYKPLVENYGSLATAGLRSEIESPTIISKRVNLFADGTMAAKGYPRSFARSTSNFYTQHAGTLDLMSDLYSYSKYTKARMNEYYTVSGEPSIRNNVDIAHYQSGLFRLANQFESVGAGWAFVPDESIGNTDIGTAVRSPFYNPYEDAEVPLSGDYNETQPSISNWYLGSEYVKAYAQLYATQDRPTSGEFPGSTPLLSSLNVGLGFNLSPRTIAASGIALSLYHFERYFNYPVYNGIPRDLNWIYTYNRLDELAGRFLNNISTAFDSIYYGNSEWAGFTGVGPEKVGSWADEMRSARLYTGHCFKRDMGFDQKFTWPNGITKRLKNHLPTMISGYKSLTDSLRPLVQAATTRGGVITPGLINTLRSYLWIPTHDAKRDTFFEGHTDSQDVATFENGIFSILKGNLTEDGIIFQSPSFKHEPVGQPYVPGHIIEAAVDGVEYYRALGDKGGEDRWMAVAQGVYNTITGVYKQDYGYPIYVNFTGSSGDSGSQLLPAMTKILGLRETQFTDYELKTLTGAASSRI